MYVPAIDYKDLRMRRQASLSVLFFKVFLDLASMWTIFRHNCESMGGMEWYIVKQGIYPLSQITTGFARGAPSGAADGMCAQVLGKFAPDGKVTFERCAEGGMA